MRGFIDDFLPSKISISKYTAKKKKKKKKTVSAQIPGHLTYCSFYLRYPFAHLLCKSCPLDFPLVLFLFYAVLIVLVPFPFGVRGRV